MKTMFALAFYYLAIGFLTACAVVIVIKLIFWPPCTQVGNTCVVEPWSVAGLAGTVLAVAATVLAVLGAVAVAAWWASLNERVNEQVKKHYSAQKAEFESRMNMLLMGQQARADGQFKGFEVAINTLHQDMHHVQELTERANEVVKTTLERSELQGEQLQLINQQTFEVLSQAQKQLAASQQRAEALEDAAKRVYEFVEWLGPYEPVRGNLEERAARLKASKQIEAVKPKDASEAGNSTNPPSG